MPLSQAKVKSVLSGDTLILTSVNNPNQERTLSLAFVSAPRIRREGDEVSTFTLRGRCKLRFRLPHPKAPSYASQLTHLLQAFAFDSRDFLRRLVVGKVIQFQVLYSIPTGVKRDYGVVMLQGGQKLPQAAVSEGWVSL